jgi:hypothetical protein
VCGGKQPMRKNRGNRHKWQITFQNVYKFGREERVQLAYETVLPADKMKIKGECDVKSETCSNRIIRKSFE